MSVSEEKLPTSTVRDAGWGIKIRFAIACLLAPVWLFKSISLMGVGIWMVRKSAGLPAADLQNEGNPVGYLGLLFVGIGLVLTLVYAGIFAGVYRSWRYQRQDPEGYAQAVAEDRRKDRRLFRTLGRVLRLAICVPLLFILISFVISNPIGWIAGGGLAYWGCHNKGTLHRWTRSLFSLE